MKKINELGIGDICICAGVKCKILSVKTTGIAAPYYRMVPIEPTDKSIKGLTSYRLCDLPKES